ncbi:MAG TPA: hypothetical protein VEP90_03395, partial [Methylomirabilota bacterium]|nr:hypothetical protein [Methylomirabilota bacterium]
LPQKLHDAVARVPVRFDAVIADEGQDFAEMWWITLLDLIKDRAQGVFYIFQDLYTIYYYNPYKGIV